MTDISRSQAWLESLRPKKRYRWHLPRLLLAPSLPGSRAILIPGLPCWR
ncbi:1,4-dihydroxy-2-naphthoate octaprenyltransferase [Klebsiella pneumoniae ISC21]|nr:1,4-dihydroxy-2-naphthoate octaprenyltransferase [Klebsiella pneumoniae ISC21]